ncbi:MAG: VCBS repeat-containing protein [Thermoguttaceae bacterium]|nr:VCBS repeat-containing protein [Thermoguttaceae bacterium]
MGRRLVSFAYGVGLAVAFVVLAGSALWWFLPPPSLSGPIRLTEVTAETGIDFQHTDGSSGRRYIVEAMSAGLALFDYNGDGRIDIYFLNGAALPGTIYDVPPTDRLYRNDGGWKFTDVTEASGLAATGFGLGVTVGDYDEDGDPDLYLNNHGPNVLYRNNGDGTFTDVTRQTGVGNGDKVGAGACFFDMEADGDLDLYAGNYLVFNPSEHVQRVIEGHPSYPSPRDFMPVPDSLFRNNGDGTFTDVSLESGIGQYAGTCMGTVCADYDNDGDSDIFVCNDVAANFFFRNDGQGHFEEIGLLNGAAYNAYGDENASMGADCGDYDNDGWQDFFMTSYQGELPVLFRNMGDGLLEDVTQLTNAGQSVLPYVNWGTGLVDFDHDGDRDIFIANGHTEDNIDQRDPSTGYRVRNTLLQNTLVENGQAQFVDVSALAGSGLEPVHSGRGTAFDDLDDDGDIDVVILNIRERPTVLRNDSPHEGRHWLQLDLRGVESNRAGVGSRVTVEAGGKQWIAEVHSGRSYQSHWGTRLHFGLGPHDRVDRVEVRWLGGGGIDVVKNLPADRLIVIREGSSPAAE